MEIFSNHERNKLCEGKTKTVAYKKKLLLEKKCAPT